jgi:hypothetical protein
VVAAIKTGGVAGHLIESAREPYATLIKDQVFPDDWWMLQIGRVPTNRKKLTEAEIAALMYLNLVHEYAPKIKAEANREQRRAAKRKPKK